MYRSGVTRPLRGSDEIVSSVFDALAYDDRSVFLASLGGWIRCRRA